MSSLFTIDHLTIDMTSPMAIIMISSIANILPQNDYHMLKNQSSHCTNDDELSIDLNNFHWLDQLLPNVIRDHYITFDHVLFTVDLTIDIYICRRLVH